MKGFLNTFGCASSASIGNLSAQISSRQVKTKTIMDFKLVQDLGVTRSMLNDYSARDAKLAHMSLWEYVSMVQNQHTAAPVSALADVTARPISGLGDKACEGPVKIEGRDEDGNDLVGAFHSEIVTDVGRKKKEGRENDRRENSRKDFVMKKLALFWENVETFPL